METTVEEVVEMLTEDEEASALIEVSYTGDGEAVVAPMALTELDGGRGPGSISTSAQVRTYLNAQETIAERVTVSGGGDNVLRPRQVMAFHGGGAHPQVTTTASSLVTLLAEDEAAQALVEASGAGSTPLQPLPRTALNRVKGQPPITSTLSEVVAAIQAHPQASALLTATASSGSLGSTVMQAMSRTYLSGSTGRTSYQWTSQDRLAGVTMPDGTQHDYSYDYRARRVGMARHGGSEPARDTAVVFSGGLSVAEYEGVPGFAVSPEAPSVHYVRGPDMGGGVGGMLYSVRGSTVKYSLSNGRGDIIAQSDASAEITWTASYEAYGKRPAETGENLDKQRANSKDEDPTGLLNEGFRYRDIETGMWLSRDPAGFVDGPNLYAYVQQNPWSKFDAEGLFWAYAVDAAFAVWDTGNWITGQIDTQEYGRRMAITGASVAINTITGGGFTGGGLVARGGVAVAIRGGITVAERAAVSTSIQTASHFNEVGQGLNNVVNAVSSDRGSDLSSSSRETQEQTSQQTDDSGGSISENARQGRRAEELAGVTDPKKAIPSATGTATRRFPDRQTAEVVGEVKDTKRVRFKGQIEDEVLNAESTGRQMTLETGTKTKLDKATQNAVNEGRIHHTTNPNFKNSD